MKKPLTILIFFFVANIFVPLSGTPQRNPLMIPIMRIITKNLVNLSTQLQQDFVRVLIKRLIGNMVIDHTVFKLGGAHIRSSHLIDYGCESVWAAAFEGINKVPGALIKYSFIDAWYNQCAYAALRCGVDYPASIKNNFWSRLAAQFICPILAKRILASAIDIAIDWGCQEESCVDDYSQNFLEPAQ